MKSPQSPSQSRRPANGASRGFLIGTRTTAVLLSLLIVTTGCRKSRHPETPKAIPVAHDMALELKVLTMNLRYENHEDPEPLAWANRIVSIVRMIRKEQPDFITTQEGLHGQVADLRASLPDYDFIGVGRDDGDRHGEYAGIWFRKDRFESDPDDRGNFWLSDTPELAGSKSWGNEITRITTWTRLIERTSQRGFYLYNTHWDHRNQASREHAARLIASRIDRRKHGDEAVILAGDFNSRETNPAIQYLTGHTAAPHWKNSMIDTFDRLHPDDPNRTTLHFWSGNAAGRLKVDHIFVSKGVQVQSAAILKQTKPMLSDHFPVTARVLIPARSARGE